MQNSRRSSPRIEGVFVVSDEADPEFDDGFIGENISQVGIGFSVEHQDMFVVGQKLHLWVLNPKFNETYSLDHVEVVHIQSLDNDRFLIGCAIHSLSSEQVLSHNRLLNTVGIDRQSDLTGALFSGLSFDFNPSLETLSDAALQEHSVSLDVALYLLNLDLNDQIRQDVKAVLQLAKLKLQLCSLRENEQNGWQRVLTDFENKYISESLQKVFNFMYQGESVVDAFELASYSYNNLPKNT
jgi:hypothetical protein